MKERFPKSGFVLKDSAIILTLVFIACMVFTVLVCFYPGPAALGAGFWVLFGIFLSLALATLYRLITIRPRLKIDAKGIRFYNNGLEVKWHNFKSASIEELPHGDGDTKTYFVFNYLQANKQGVQQVLIPLDGLNDKSGEEIIAAIRHYKK